MLHNDDGLSTCAIEVSEIFAYLPTSGGKKKEDSTTKNRRKQEILLSTFSCSKH
jgi:hypothetical protein